MRLAAWDWAIIAAYSAALALIVRNLWSDSTFLAASVDTGAGPS